MKRIICCLLGLLFLNSIYSQKPTSSKTLLTLLEESKIKNEVCFAVMLNGDTLRGNSLTKKRNVVSGKSRWFIGDKMILPDSVGSYQDEYSYVYVYPFGNDIIKKDAYGTEFRRLYIGKICLFMAVAGKEIYKQTGSQSTMFYLSTDSLGISPLMFTTTEYLKEMISGCKPALELFDQSFRKANNTITVDFNKILAILRKFDSCN